MGIIGPQLLKLRPMSGSIVLIARIPGCCARPGYTSIKAITDGGKGEVTEIGEYEQTEWEDGDTSGDYHEK